MAYLMVGNLHVRGKIHDADILLKIMPRSFTWRLYKANTIDIYMYVKSQYDTCRTKLYKCQLTLIIVINSHIEIQFISTLGQIYQVLYLQ